MPSLSLQTAMVSYGHTKPLIEGTVNSHRVTIEHVPVSPITTAFRRMVRGLEYDLSEMALSTYLYALVHQKPSSRPCLGFPAQRRGICRGYGSVTLNTTCNPYHA